MTNASHPVDTTAYHTALITGASSGLGRGLALAFGNKGSHVIAAARTGQLIPRSIYEWLASKARRPD